jgi:uncharacterized protein YbdZ (MbtH family)
MVTLSGNVPEIVEATKSAMYRNRARHFKVVFHPEGRYRVWFSDAPRQRPWQETGQTGTEDDCWDYVESAESAEGYIFQFGGGIDWR